jgi:hypothetical protein
VFGPEIGAQPEIVNVLANEPGTRSLFCRAAVDLKERLDNTGGLDLETSR